MWFASYEDNLYKTKFYFLGKKINEKYHKVLCSSFMTNVLIVKKMSNEEIIMKEKKNNNKQKLNNNNNKKILIKE